MITAAVLKGPSEDLVVHDDIEIAAPGPGEVKVKMVASGVCHSDLSVQNGTIPLPTPIVLGHEGAGIVEEVGDGVTDVAPGDHVVLSFVPACGYCYYCDRGQCYLCEKGAMQVAGGLLDGTTRLTLGGEPLRQMAMCGTFGNYAIVPEISRRQDRRRRRPALSPPSSAAACSPASAPRSTPPASVRATPSPSSAAAASAST